MSNKKKCFVVTPIGDINSKIRRHIDGIIDQAIIPALKDKYDIEVAHREYEIGSINDRVINAVYSADLVVANLTSLNPNVMFELAIRYSFGKPAIVIAEKSSESLPFDIIDENTIFYVNDPMGAAELSEEIKKFEQNINFNEETYGPVYNAIKKRVDYEALKRVEPEKVDTISIIEYISKELNRINNKIDRICNNIEIPNNKISRDEQIYQEIDKLLKEYNEYVNDGYDARKKEKLLNKVNYMIDILGGSEPQYLKPLFKLKRDITGK